MSQHTEIGDIAIKVGFYEKAGEIKSRYRRVGTLMKTTDNDGDRFWMKLNADALNPSLLIITRAQMEKGADQVLLSVFEDRGDRKQQEAPADPDVDTQ